MEKADILEMTVHYLNNVLLEKKLPIPVTKVKQQSTKVASPATKSSDSYVIARQKGYAQCAKDANVFLEMENVSVKTRNLLLVHLNCQLFGQTVEVREIDSDTRTEEQRLKQSAHAFVKDESSTQTLLSSKRHGVNIVPCDVQSESLKSRSSSPSLLTIKSKSNILSTSQQCGENRDWNDINNDSNFLKYEESRLFSTSSDFVSFSKRHCSSSDSGNWSSGSRPCSPNEVAFIKTNENYTNVKSSPLSRSEMSCINLKEKVWRPWEF